MCLYAIGKTHKQNMNGYKVFTKFKGELYPAFKNSLLLKQEYEGESLYYRELLVCSQPFVFENRTIVGNFHAFCNLEDAKKLIEKKYKWNLNAVGDLVIYRVECETETIGFFRDNDVMRPAFIASKLRLVSEISLCV